MKDLTKYRRDLESEYIRVGTKYWRFVVQLSIEGKECGIYLRPWNIRTMKDDDIDFDDVPKYDAFNCHSESHLDYPHLFSLKGFKKARCKLEYKNPVRVYQWIGIEAAEQLQAKLS